MTDCTKMTTVVFHFEYKTKAITNHYNRLIMSTDYDDIINLPHPVSKHHPPMSMANRAAQFSSFAALTGHKETLRETARTTQDFEEPSADQREELDRKLTVLREKLSERPGVCVTYFEPDTKKAGGRYLQVVGEMCRVNEDERCMELATGSGLIKIPFRFIVDLNDVEG